MEAVLEGQPASCASPFPDGDCKAYTVQPHKIVNGMARYLKNHSFYYLRVRAWERKSILSIIRIPCSQTLRNDGFPFTG